MLELIVRDWLGEIWRRCELRGMILDDEDEEEKRWLCILS